MKPIVQHSIQRASDQALILWALSSAQYPKDNEIILNIATGQVIDAISQLALNGRRSLETVSKSQKFELTQPRWRWEPTKGHALVKDFRYATNRIIHAKSLKVGYEELPPSDSVIHEGAMAIPYIEAETEDRKAAFIDPFALSHAYLYQVVPFLLEKYRGQIPNVIH